MTAREKLTSTILTRFPPACGLQRRAWLVPAWLLGLAAAGAALAQPIRHDRVYVVPAPREVQVDGDLKDWDLSGAIDAAFDESLRPRFALRYALMYDAARLYIAAHFADDTPLRNQHDPKVEPDRGWAGDALQVRLCSDASAPYPLTASNSDRICHLTMWRYSGTGQPALQMQFGMDYHGRQLWVGADADLAFRPDADGHGYTLEAAIPWSRLHAGDSPPRADDRIALVVQPLWSDGAGWKQALTFNDVVREAGFSFQGTRMWGQAIFSPTGHLPPQIAAATTPDQPPLHLRLPVADNQARQLSAAIFDGAGKLCRTLPVQSLSPPAEAVEFAWDGLDDDGKPLPSDDYAIHCLTHRGIAQRWVASLHTAGNPPWRTDDGTGAWGGDHGPPTAAASDKDRVYLGWTVSEAGTGVIALDRRFTADGKVRKLWGQRQVLDVGITVTALASDGQRLFVAQDGLGWGAKKLLAQGKSPPGTAGVVMWDAATGKPVNFPFGKRALVISQWSEKLKLERPPLWERVRKGDLGPQDAGMNLLGIAVRGDRLYAALYLENKVVAFDWKSGKQVGSFPLPHPAGLAFAADGGLLAASGKSILHIDLQTGERRPFVSSGLASPWAVAVDDQGRVYVTDCGKAMQVKVYSPQGRRLGVIGRTGGRPWIGRYEPQGMLMPSGIAVDAENKVWVCERDNQPRRVSVWSREGKLLHDLLGPGAYAVEGNADLEHPSWINLHHTLFELDYASGRSRPIATLIRPNLIGRQVVPDTPFMGRALKFRRCNGRTYVVSTGRSDVLVYLMSDDFVCQPVAALGRGSVLKLKGFTDDMLPASVLKDFRKRPDLFAYRWTDLNGDRLYQTEELTIERVEINWGLYWGAWIDQDLTIWSAPGYRSGKVFAIPVERFLPNGAPLYPPPHEQRPLFEALGKTKVHHVMPAGDAVYVLEQQGGTPRGDDAEWMAISRYTRDGKREWAYRNVWLGFALESPLYQPGRVIGAMKFIGNVKLDGGAELIGVNGYFGQFNLLTGGGLWVTAFCKEKRFGPPADENTVWPENFSGFLFRNREDGKVYLIAGDTDVRVWEITGLESLRTSEVELHLSPDDHEKASRFALHKRGLGGDENPVPMVRQSITVDGDLREWSPPMMTVIDLSRGAHARAGLAYDGENLYLAFDVPDDSPMENAGEDFALLFKSGDACDLMLTTSPRADPKRTRPAPGDVRLLFSVLDGNPLCVLYEPVMRRGPQARRLFRSPVGIVSFDRVVQLETAMTVVHRRGDGYTLEAAVPLKDLGFRPQPGSLVQGDLGVLLSNQGGSQTVLRRYRFNRQTAIVDDIPSEARLEPHHWGGIRIVGGKE